MVATSFESLKFLVWQKCYSEVTTTPLATQPWWQTKEPRLKCFSKTYYSKALVRLVTPLEAPVSWTKQGPKVKQYSLKHFPFNLSRTKLMAQRLAGAVVVGVVALHIFINNRQSKLRDPTQRWCSIKASIKAFLSSQARRRPPQAKQELLRTPAIVHRPNTAYKITNWQTAHTF